MGGLEASFPAAGFAPPFEHLRVLLSIEDEAWLAEGLGDLHELVLGSVRAAAAGAGLPADVATELGVTLTGDAAMRGLNAEWRGQDKPTNVLSFPMVQLAPGDRPGPILGDIVLARETLLREASAEKISPDAHFRHLVVHGVLHCLGFDHVEAGAADVMERLETKVLATLAIADPYAMTEIDETYDRLAS